MYADVQERMGVAGQGAGCWAIPMGRVDSAPSCSCQGSPGASQTWRVPIPGYSAPIPGHAAPIPGHAALILPKAGGAGGN